MRNSEALETKAVILESQGQVAQKDIDNAYRYFGFEPSHAPFLNDNHILETYRARLPDLGSNEQTVAKDNLRRIANVTNSEILKSIVSRSMSRTLD